ncbi:Hint domain-containing protein [Aliiroseovarius sp. 2305UL8-7]|uniref:Hint domain-containing protein n=1 Tax=Aliiroseovarius conchicola TaxID=3121637 RepID=UPI0035281C8F
MTPMSHSGDAVAGYVRDGALVSGIGPGALVQTLHGTRAIETLAPGDQVLTKDRRRVRLSLVTCTAAPARALYRISPKALAQGRHREKSGPIILSGQQHVLVSGWMAQAMYRRDQALVPVHALADGELIRPMGLDADLPLFHLHFDEPDLFCVGGLEFLATPAHHYIR